MFLRVRHIGLKLDYYLLLLLIFLSLNCITGEFILTRLVKLVNLRHKSGFYEGNLSMLHESQKVWYTGHCLKSEEDKGYYGTDININN